jgi:hypothetical protein
MVLVYKSLFVPTYEYGIAVYGFSYPSNIKRIETIMNRALRVITFSERRTSAAPLYQRLNLKTFSESLRQNSTKYIFKAMHGLSSTASTEFFKFKNSRTSRHSDQHMLDLPEIKTNFLRNTIFYNGVKLYNDLPLISRQAENFNSFLNSIIT